MPAQGQMASGSTTTDKVCRTGGWRHSVQRWCRMHTLDPNPGRFGLQVSFDTNQRV